MPNRRTTAQINTKTLSRLKEVAKARNQPLYVLLEEAVVEFLKNENLQKESTKIGEHQRKKKNLYRELLEIKPLSGKNKWVTTGIGGMVWYLFTLFLD